MMIYIDPNDGTVTDADGTVIGTADGNQPFGKADAREVVSESYGNEPTVLDLKRTLAAASGDIVLGQP